MKGQVVQGFCGKRMPLCGRNNPDAIRRTVSSTKAENSWRCSSVIVALNNLFPPGQSVAPAHWEIMTDRTVSPKATRLSFEGSVSQWDRY